MQEFVKFIKRSVGIIVATLGYSIIQGFYIVPNMKEMGPTLFYIIVGLGFALTILGFFVMWTSYVTQLKHDNPRGFNSKFRFSWINVGITILGVFAILGMQVVFSIIIGPAEPQNQVDLNEIGASGSPLFYIMVTLVAPIFEEIIFRGYVTNLLLRKDTRLNRFIVIILGGLLFGLLHEPHFSIFLLMYSTMGAIFMMTYLYTKDLRYSMVVHIINNVMSVL